MKKSQCTHKNAKFSLERGATLFQMTTRKPIKIVALFTVISAFFVSILSLTVLHSTAQAQEINSWGGLRGKVLKQVLQWERDKSRVKMTYIWPSSFPSYYYITHKEGDKVEFGRLEIGVNGIRQFAEQFLDNYIWVDSDGEMMAISPSTLNDVNNFSLIRESCKQGGQLQMLGFPNNFVFPKRNPLIFHPGPVMAKSVIKERLGKLDPSLDPRLDGYGGREGSRLYSVNRATGLKENMLGYLVDVYAPDGMRNDEGEPIQPRLKRFISVSSKNSVSVPEYVFVLNGLLSSGSEILRRQTRLIEQGRPSRSFLLPNENIYDAGTNLSEPFLQTQVVVDDDLRPSEEGIFFRFDQPLLIQGLNRF